MGIDIHLSYEDSKKLASLFESSDQTQDINGIAYPHMAVHRRWLREQYQELCKQYDRHADDMWVFDPKFTEENIDSTTNFRVANIMYHGGTEDQRVFVQMKWGNELIFHEERKSKHG